MQNLQLTTLCQRHAPFSINPLAAQKTKFKASDIMTKYNERIDILYTVRFVNAETIAELINCLWYI